MSMGKTRRAVIRGICAALTGGFFLRKSRAAECCQRQKALLEGFRTEQVYERRYRADAAITLGGLTIFTRRGVGGGLASVESGTCVERSAVSLSFVAGSDPGRCAGLNRFGILQEVVLDLGPRPAFAFAGLITDNKEENLEQAKQALRSDARQQLKMARGRTLDGRVQAWTDTIGLAQPCTWKDSAELLARLSEDPPRAPMREIAADAAPFLSAYRKAALSAEEVSKTPFLHAGTLYSLELRRRDKGERDGLIRDQNGAKSADFRVLEAPGDTSGLPARIEYRAKSYLKLVFEADDHVERPHLETLFTKERHRAGAAPAESGNWICPAATGSAAPPISKEGA